MVYKHQVINEIMSSNGRLMSMLLCIGSIVCEINTIDVEMNQWDDMKLKVTDLEEGMSYRLLFSLQSRNVTEQSPEEEEMLSQDDIAFAYGVTIMTFLILLTSSYLISKMKRLSARKPHQNPHHLTFLTSLRQCTGREAIEKLVEATKWPLTSHLWSLVQFHRRYLSLQATRSQIEPLLKPFTDRIDLPPVLRSLSHAIYEATALQKDSPIEMQPQVTQLLSFFQTNRSKLSRLRTARCQALKEAIRLENWLELDEAIDECEKIGLLNDLMEEMDPNASFALDSSTNEGFHTICLRIQMKHKVTVALEKAKEPSMVDEDTIKSTLALAEKHSWTHLSLYQDVSTKLARLEDAKHQEQLVLMETKHQNRMDRCLRLVDTSGPDDPPSLAMVSELERVGLDRQEALKLVMSKVADRENVLLKIQAEMRLEEQRMLENRRRDVEKRQAQKDLVREQMKQQARQHEELCRENLRRDQEKLRSKLALAKQKQEAQRQRDIELFEQQENDRLRVLVQAQLHHQHESDRKHVAFIMYCDFVLTASLFCLLFWEHLHATGFLTPQCSHHWLVPNFTCQIVFILKLAAVLLLVGLFYTLCCYWHQPFFGTLSLGALLLYIFRAEWKSTLWRSYWLLGFVVFNAIMGAFLSQDTKLHWNKAGIDWRPVLKYLVFPIASFALTIFCTFQMACENPIVCFTQLFNQIHAAA